MRRLMAFVALLMLVGCMADQKHDEHPPLIRADGSPPAPFPFPYITLPPVSLNVSLENLGWMNVFAFDAFRVLDNAGENTFFSPVSIVHAAAPLYLGANGDTRDELANVFHFPNESRMFVDDLQASFKALRLPEGAGDLLMNSKLWVNESLGLKDDFRGELPAIGVPVESIDFASSGASRRVNAWIRDATKGKIGNVFQSSADLELVSMNAVYFKGKWQHQFDKGLTERKVFTTESDERVRADMMELEETNLPYFANDKFEAVELPYEGGKLSMIIVLPKHDLSIYNTHRELARIGSVNALLRGTDVHVVLPKFKFDKSMNLNGALNKLGMVRSFSDAADFSRMSETPLKVSKAVQDVFVDVNEEGTEAAAVTRFELIELSSVEPYVPEIWFVADHPFLFFIQEKESGLIVFMGKIAKPEVD